MGQCQDCGSRRLAKAKNFQLVCICGWTRGVPSSSTSSTARNQQPAAVKGQRPLKWMRDVAARLKGVPPFAIREANNIYQSCPREQTSSSRTDYTQAIASLYLALKNLHLPRSMKDICAASSINKKQLSEAHKLAVQQTSATLTTTPSVSYYVDKIFGELKVKSEYCKAAMAISDRVLDLGLGRSQGNLVVAAAVVFLTLERHTPKEKVPLRHIATASGLLEGNILNIFQEVLLPHMHELIGASIQAILPHNKPLNTPAPADTTTSWKAGNAPSQYSCLHCHATREVDSASKLCSDCQQDQCLWCGRVDPIAVDSHHRCFGCLRVQLLNDRLRMGALKLSHKHRHAMQAPRNVLAISPKLGPSRSNVLLPPSIPAENFKSFNSSTAISRGMEANERGALGTPLLSVPPSPSYCAPLSSDDLLLLLGGGGMNEEVVERVDRGDSHQRPQYQVDWEGIARRSPHTGGHPAPQISLLNVSPQQTDLRRSPRIAAHSQWEDKAEDGHKRQRTNTQGGYHIVGTMGSSQSNGMQNPSLSVEAIEGVKRQLQEGHDARDLMPPPLQRCHSWEVHHVLDEEGHSAEFQDRGRMCPPLGARELMPPPPLSVRRSPRHHQSPHHHPFVNNNIGTEETGGDYSLPRRSPRLAQQYDMKSDMNMPISMTEMMELLGGHGNLEQYGSNF